MTSDGKLVLRVDEFALMQVVAAYEPVPLSRISRWRGGLAYLLGAGLLTITGDSLGVTSRGLQFLYLCEPTAEGGAVAKYDALPRFP